MPIPMSPSLKASVIMAENIRLNSDGSRMQPYFTPFVTGKGSYGKNAGHMSFGIEINIRTSLSPSIYTIGGKQTWTTHE